MTLSPKETAEAAREASLKLRVLSTTKREELLNAIADALEQQKGAIMVQNAIDIKNAMGKIADALLKRLQLTETKLDSAISGIRQIARTAEPIGRCLYQKQIMNGLVLKKVTQPIGVLLIIFEARPEALLQITALAIRSGNGLLLKGGKEAFESNAILHNIINDVITRVIPSIGTKLIHLIETREEIGDLLKLDGVIDLVIPRGSKALVSYIQQNTKIAVLGHADGICHVYIDEEVDTSMAVDICIDSKLDYPAACNAVEKILIHEALLHKEPFKAIIDALASNGVKLYKGVHKALSDFDYEPAPSQRHEYSGLEVTLEGVDDVKAAIDHVNTYGSGHTDTIVTNNPDHAREFCAHVDSSCVHHNASTRWSDGYRYGLGAEVGISTSRIHARGPVGVEGLLTTKFVVQGNGHLVKGDANKNAYQFKRLPSETECGSMTKSLYFVAGVGTAAVTYLILSLLRGTVRT